MTTIADSMQNAAQAVNDAAAQYAAAATGLNNEIGSVAAGAGLDPTQNIGTRLLRAVRSGQLGFVLDTSTTPGVITVDTAKPHTAYIDGLPLVVRLNQAISGATQINLSGIGLKPVRHLGGGDLQKLDYLATDLMAIFYNAAAGAFVVSSPINGAVIDAAVTKTVHGPGADFADLNAAFVWLGRRRIAATGSVTFACAIGVNANRKIYANDVVFSHPDGLRVSIVGAPLQGALPAGASMSFTGASAAARATDTGVNLTLLRNFYQSEISFQGGKRLYVIGNLGNIQDILTTSDGAGSSDNIICQFGNLSLTRVASVGSGYRGICALSSTIQINGTCYALGNANYGASGENSGTLALALGALLVTMSNGLGGATASSGSIGQLGAATGTVYARGNGTDGIQAIAGNVSILTGAVSRDNGGHGYYADSGTIKVPNSAASGNGGNGYLADAGTIKASGSASASNGANGFLALTGGNIDASATTGAGNASQGYGATNGSNIVRTGGSCTGSAGSSSPAVGSVGNNNSYIA